MLLAIDIGNTNIKCGFFNGAKFIQHISISEFNEVENKLADHSFTSAAICSVVPHKTELFIKYLRDKKNITPYIIIKDSKFNLELNYKTPETLGIDRICSCEGAYHLIDEKLRSSDYLVTIDFGTATTINILKPPNVFIGGVIAPGVQTMFESLKLKTSQLPSLKIENYLSLVGEDTNSSIASGVINSTLGLIHRVIDHLYNFYNCKNLNLFITGGMADQIKNFIDIDYTFEEYLVLKGIRSVYELNNT